jgi:hypothetical protein
MRGVLDPELAERHVGAPGICEDGALLGLDRSLNERCEGGRRRAGDDRETHGAGRSGASFDRDPHPRLGVADSPSNRLFEGPISLDPSNSRGNGPLAAERSKIRTSSGQRRPSLWNPAYDERVSR